MKHKLFVIVLLIQSLLCFAQTKKSYFEAGSHRYVALSDEKIEFRDMDLDFTGQKDDIWNNLFDYKIQQNNNVHFMIIKNTMITKKFLILYSNDLLFLYDEKCKEPYFIGYNTVPLEFTDPIKSIKIDSSLNENGCIYGPENLSIMDLGKPWVEGEPDYGIGLKIELSSYWHIIFISTGFISFNNPKLFMENSRPKTLRFIFKDINKDFAVELKDTPDPQCIEIPKDCKGTCEIEIVDVYKGTKYKDTCINFMLTSMMWNKK